MEEQKAVYRLVDRHVNGLETIKFTVEKIDSSKVTTASMEDIIKLARLGKMQGLDALIDTVNQKYILDYKGSLSNLPIHKSAELTLVCRILDDNKKCIGYKATDNSGKTYKLSINKTWELASIDCVNNVKAKVIGNKKALVGYNDFLISSLPKIEE